MRARVSLLKNFETTNDEIGVATHYASGAPKRARQFEREIVIRKHPLGV